MPAPVSRTFCGQNEQFVVKIDLFRAFQRDKAKTGTLLEAVRSSWRVNFGRNKAAKLKKAKLM